MQHSHEVQSALFWCDVCNVPLVGRSCGKCGQEGRGVELLPPGEVRIALDGTKRRLRYLFLRNFGVQQLVPEVVLLNKTSGEDRAEEVIIDGMRVAKLWYDLEARDYRLTLRLDGARMLAAMDPRKTVVLSRAEGHMKGKHVPPGTIQSLDPGIRAGDEVVLLMGRFIGCGTAKVDAAQLRSSEKGIKVREFARADPIRPRKRAWTKAVVRANQHHMAAKRAKAEHEIRGAMAEHPLPLTVSFSGGKDSLVVLDIVRSVTNDFATIFIDTGLEHPSTREYVRAFAESQGLRLLTASAGDAFDENMPAFGPPAKDFRWCCKVCKLAPVAKLIEERFPGGTLTVEGNRRLESFSRAGTGLVEENPFVPGQVMVNPIRDWTALEVWLHIISAKLPYNPLYDEDIERVGCWMCPSSLACESEEMARISPDLSRAWQAKLGAWAEENSLPAEFVTYGFWRWKELPPKMKELADRLGMKVSPKRADTLALRVIKGVSPCTAGGYSVDAAIALPEARGLSQTAEVLKTVGDVAPNEEFGVVLVRTRDGAGKAFAGGQVSAVAPAPEGAVKLFGDVARAVLRANMCTRCGICVRACPKGAIKVDDAIVVDEALCDRCGACAESCVVAHYFDKLADGLGGPKKAKAGGRRR
jgi:phosphoadenosine phosphosulfate reductase